MSTRVSGTTTSHDLDVALPDDQDQSSDGGIGAYLKVAGCFIIFFVTLGISSAFGSYQAYYEQTLLSGYSPSAISWIGTLQVFLLSFGGTFSGAFFDRGHVRSVLSCGLGLLVLGLCMLSLARTYSQILLTQGLCVGLGSGFLYVPAVSIVSNSFTARRAIALGVAATGTAIGGVVWPIMFRTLIDSVSFAWVNRIFGFLVLFLAIASYFLLVGFKSPSAEIRRSQQRHELTAITPAQSRTHDPRQASMDRSGPRVSPRNILSSLYGRAYLFLCVGVFFVFLGYWVPLFYVVPFATRSLGASPTYASYLLAILNAGSFFGRLVPPYFGHVFGTAIILFAGAIGLGILVLVWLGIGNVAGLTVWCFLVGFMSGIVVSIPNAVASRLSQRSNIGFRIGVMWTAGAFAELVGSPIAGSLVKKTDAGVSYLGGQIFGGLSILIGAALLAYPAQSIYKDDKVREARHA